MWKRTGVGDRLFLAAHPDKKGNLTCCCSQGGPGRDTQQLSLEFPCP